MDDFQGSSQEQWHLDYLLEAVLGSFDDNLADQGIGTRSFVPLR